jgi:ribosomal protein S18 acetylase RimI-like enzyme
MTIERFSLDYTWRSLRYDDLAALRALILHNAEPEDNIDTLADMQKQFDDPWSNPATDALVGLTMTGDLIAYARCFISPEPTREAAVNLDFEIHPAHRSEPLEDWLLGWMAQRAQARVQTLSPALPRMLRCGLPNTRTADGTLFARHGYTPSRYFYRMRRDLREPLPMWPTPEGVTLHAYAPEYDQAMLEVFNASFRDHWGHEAVIREDWEKFFIGTEKFRPDLSLVAVVGGEVVGLSFNEINRASNQRSGRNEGTITELGVLRAWRKRGIASALLIESMRRFRAAGLDYAALGVDTANPTGALGLYEKLGFRQVRHFTVYEKALV